MADITLVKTRVIAETWIPLFAIHLGYIENEEQTALDFVKEKWAELDEAWVAPFISEMVVKGAMAQAEVQATALKGQFKSNGTVEVE